MGTEGPEPRDEVNIKLMGIGEASSQYNVVLKQLQALTERLQLSKEEETLLQKFKMEKWIAGGATATANELVLLALDRIKNQVTDYDVFIRMLKSMPGVKSIADQMTGMYNIHTVEPLKKGHFGNRPFALCLKIVPISKAHS